MGTEPDLAENREAERQPGDRAQPAAPPLRVRLMGQTLSLAIARAPWLWPLLRRPTQRFWERMAGGWEERVRQGGPERVAPLVAACERLPAPPESILEVGTGTGLGAVTLATRFPDARVRAVDLSEAMIARARANLPAEVAGRIELAVSDAASLPYADAEFDLVAQLNVPAFVEEVARVLRPRGHFVVASTHGPRTPYYTPDAVLARICERHGLERAFSGESRRGTYFVARRTG